MKIDLNNLKAIEERIDILRSEVAETTRYDLGLVSTLSDVAKFVEVVRTREYGIIDSTLSKMNVLSDSRTIVIEVDTHDQVRFNGADIEVCARFEKSGNAFATTVDFVSDDDMDVWFSCVHGKMLQCMNPQLLLLMFGPTAVIDPRLMARLIDGTVKIAGLDNQSEVFKNWDVVRNQIIECQSDVDFEFCIFTGTDS